ncbi:MAG TPA: hypothetical protein VGI56_10180 [Galbitalea sp.]
MTLVVSRAAGLRGDMRLDLLGRGHRRPTTGGAPLVLGWLGVHVRPAADTGNELLRRPVFERLGDAPDAADVAAAGRASGALTFLKIWRSFRG